MSPYPYFISLFLVCNSCSLLTNPVVDKLAIDIVEDVIEDFEEDL